MNVRAVVISRGGGVLNPLVVMLAVSTWERLVYEVGTAVSFPVSERETVGRLGWRNKQSKAARTLAQATAQCPAPLQLPGALILTFFDGAVGKRLGSPVELSAVENYDDMSKRLDDFIELRNGVAHRVLPNKMAAPSYEGMGSDAGPGRRSGEARWSGRTLNTSIARSVLATYVQLVDQTIACLLTSESIEGREAGPYRLPAWWFTDDHEQDGIRFAQPGCLWGGAKLPRRPQKMTT
ncbi:hypothetical protein HCA58_06445 [Micromonospora sp. HNM0581]|uniref:hypothetical protein n=1 Tax=Micromonospora sp. HNM0581 TaxID=2716341 RepID=UPI00146AEC23|nr:hypothetical protein [Micromonospora sp. HNM0581]NLU78035.1 hypothetical protein [Micromonospora sp. HNM0581]